MTIRPCRSTRWRGWTPNPPTPAAWAALAVAVAMIPGGRHLDAWAAVAVLAAAVVGLDLAERARPPVLESTP